MSLIMQKLREKENLVAAGPIGMPTSLDLERVGAVVTDVVRRMNEAYDEERASTTAMGRWWKSTTGRPEQFHLYVAEGKTQDRVFVSVGLPAASILAMRGKLTGPGPGWWLAQITIKESGNEGPRHLEIELLRWVLEDNGKIKQLGKYQEFVDHLGTVLAEMPRRR